MSLETIYAPLLRQTSCSLSTTAGPLIFSVKQRDKFILFLLETEHSDGNRLKLMPVRMPHNVVGCEHSERKGIVVCGGLCFGIMKTAFRQSGRIIVAQSHDRHRFTDKIFHISAIMAEDLAMVTKYQDAIML